MTNVRVTQVANAEIGRDTSARRFWQDAGRAVDARGALLAAFDQMAALMRDFHTQRAQVREPDRRPARYARPSG